MTPPASVAPPPRDPCVEPIGDVVACVDSLWTAAGYGYELGFMHSVVTCESGFNPGAVGDSGRALGLFQIRIDYHYSRRPPEWWETRQWASPAENTRVALEIRRESGWSPWSCSRSGVSS